MTEKFKPSVVAIDSNVFIEMAKLDADFKPKHRKNCGFKQTVRDMKRMAVNGHIKFIILPSVFSEIITGLTEKEEQFLNDYCYIYNPKNPEDFALKVANIANIYTSTSTMRSKDKHPMKDALIMAEATVAGLSLITNNVKDFTNYDKYRKEKSGERMRDIRSLNDGLGFACFIDERKIIPAPYTSFEFLQIFRDKQFVVDNEFYKAIKIIDETKLSRQITM